MLFRSPKRDRHRSDPRFRPNRYRHRVEPCGAPARKGARKVTSRRNRALPPSCKRPARAAPARGAWRAAGLPSPSACRPRQPAGPEADAALGAMPPRWWHVPLIRGEDGLRLAKRHGDTRVSSFAEAGVPSERIMGLIASWCGIGDSDTPAAVDAREFAATFDITRLCHEDITLTQENLAWLTDC